MATFGELRTRLRDTKLVEAPTDFYQESTLLEMLVNASREIAATFKFPRESYTDTTTAITDSTATMVKPIVEVLSVAVNGIPLRRVDWPTITFMLELPNTAFPRAWYHDPNAEGIAVDTIVYFAPRASALVDVRVHYVTEPYVDANGDRVEPGSATDVWDGMHNEYHDLVLYRAVVDAIEMGAQFDDAAYYTQQYQAMIGEFAAHLGLQMQGAAQ